MLVGSTFVFGNRFQLLRSLSSVFLAAWQLFLHLPTSSLLPAHEQLQKRHEPQPVPVSRCPVGPAPQNSPACTLLIAPCVLHVPASPSHPLQAADTSRMPPAPFHLPALSASATFRVSAEPFSFSHPYVSTSCSAPLLLFKALLPNLAKHGGVRPALCAQVWASPHLKAPRLSSARASTSTSLSPRPTTEVSDPLITPCLLRCCSLYLVPQSMSRPVSFSSAKHCAPTKDTVQNQAVLHYTAS